MQNKINWIKPFGKEEHDEVIVQLEGILNHGSKAPLTLCAMLGTLVNPTNYQTALQRSSTMIMNKSTLVNITRQFDQGNLTLNFSALENDKKTRVIELFSKPNRIKMPIFLRRANHWWLLAGNTRTAYCYENNIEPNVCVISY